MLNNVVANALNHKTVFYSKYERDVLWCPDCYQTDLNDVWFLRPPETKTNEYQGQFWLLLKLDCNELHADPFLYVHVTATWP